MKLSKEMKEELKVKGWFGLVVEALAVLGFTGILFFSMFLLVKLQEYNLGN
jgi:hypothetical protein